MTVEPISDERLAEIRAGDFVRSLITAAEYDCYDKFEDRFISPPEKHPAIEAARIILGLLSRLDRAEAGWQDISTAPKDGTSVLVADGDGAVFEARWLEDHEEWWRTNNDPTDHWGQFIEATHWRPLPPPPSES